MITAEKQHSKKIKLHKIIPGPLDILSKNKSNIKEITRCCAPLDTNCILLH